MRKSTIIYTAVIGVTVTIERHHCLLWAYPGTHWMKWETPTGEPRSTELVMDDFGNLITPQSVGYRDF